MPNTQPTESASAPLAKPPLAELSSTAARIVKKNGTGEYFIDDSVAAQAVDVAQRIGQIDATTPGFDAHSPKHELPSERSIVGSVKVEIAEIGQRVDSAISDSRQGKLLTTEAPPKVPTGKEKLLGFLSKHRFVIFAFVAIGVLEWMIGTQWTQRVFNLTEDEGHVIALALPIIFGLVGLAVAQAIMVNAESHARRISRILMVVVTTLFIVLIVDAGLIVSKTVNPSSSGATDSGLSGGDLSTTAAPPADSASAYTVVKLLVYVSLLLMVTFLVMLMHLTDLRRERKKEVEAQALRAMNALTPEQIAGANLKYLESFLDLYDAVLATRQSIIDAYISGVRSSLKFDLADVWTPDRLTDDLPKPKWVTDLETEIAELEQVAQASGPDRAVTSRD